MSWNSFDGIDLNLHSLVDAYASGLGHRSFAIEELPQTFFAASTILNHDGSKK